MLQGTELIKYLEEQGVRFYVEPTQYTNDPKGDSGGSSGPNDGGVNTGGTDPK